MKVYLDDGTEKRRVETSDWESIGVAEFHPGDKLVIVISANIFFESEEIKRRLQSYIDSLAELEKLIETYEFVTFLSDVVSSAINILNASIESLDDVLEFAESVQTNVELIMDLIEAIASLEKAITSDEVSALVGGNPIILDMVKTVLGGIPTNPQDLLAPEKAEEIKRIINQINAIKSAIAKANRSDTEVIFDTLRELIAALPVRFVVDNVVLTPSEDNTTSIPYNFVITNTGPRYFGVSNISKLLLSITTEGMAGVIKDEIPLIDLMLGASGDSEAMKYIKATENEIESFKVVESTGEAKIKVWVERSGAFSASYLSSNIVTDYELSCSDENAVFEDGCLVFTGSTILSLKLKSLGVYTLYIEGPDGLLTYVIESVEPHECMSGELKVLLSPTTESDGFGVFDCVVCGEIMDVKSLSHVAVCEKHDFGAWEDVVSATCTEAGIRSHVCNECGVMESEFVDATGHAAYKVDAIEPTCEKEGYTLYSCDCGQNSYTDDHKSALGHSCDANGVCTMCGLDITEGCNCKCHKRGIAKFFWNILMFFCKLFNINPVCDCGFKHY